ncbi:MAG: hypothetical protein LIO37_02975 [Clostridiales bacterium]|nr:hypothetical protein [Clostridiales bacterium]
MDQEVYLKNVTQIGTPGPSGKIYIADDAYSRIHMDEYRDVRVFVLMGHTECSAGKYTTFIEAAISVEDISFIRSIPVWTNKVWNRVYTEIKRSYDNMIIVGWAMDQKGIAPTVNHELESIQREHFGGVNQVLLLLDSERQEERFYLSSNNRLYPKDGFYIYYSCGRRKEETQAQVELDIPPETKVQVSHESMGPGHADTKHSRDYSGTEYSREYISAGHSSVYSGSGHGGERVPQGSSHGGDYYESEGRARGQYRKMMAAQKNRHTDKPAGKFNVAAAVVTVALVAGIAVTGIRKDPGRAAQLDGWIETISNGVFGITDEEESTPESEHIIYFTTESGESSTGDLPENSEFADDGEQQSSEADSDAQKTSSDTIPIEEVDGGI